MKINALVPMRHVSVRVPNKNFKPFGNGKPLFTHVLNSLQNSKFIQDIYINTDSDVVKEYCKKYHEKVILIDRPKNLIKDDISMNEKIKYDLSKIKGDFFIQTHSTNPLIKSTTIDKAIECFFSKFPENDSLFSCTKFQNRLWSFSGQPINHDKNILTRTQDLPPLYEENSCIYIFERKSFLSSNNRIGDNPYIFEIEKFEAQDIDEKFDFFIAEQIFNYKNQ